MTALIIALASLAVLAYQARRHAERIERTKAFVRRANERAERATTRAIGAEQRAEAAEQRLRDVRDTMLKIAEAEAARVADEQRTRRPAIAYVMPVRALPRPRVSEPAPACVECARREVLNAVAAASRTPVVDIELGTGPINPFVVRWGDA